MGHLQRDRQARADLGDDARAAVPPHPGKRCGGRSDGSDGCLPW
jgi:hypothetical protein